MNKPQILIIEDDNAIGNLISTSLETQHYQYRRAKTSSPGVLRWLCRLDVILLDLTRPDMDGGTSSRRCAPGATPHHCHLCPQRGSRQGGGPGRRGGRLSDQALLGGGAAGPAAGVPAPGALRQREGGRGGQHLPERRAENRLRRRLHLPEREGDPPDPHRVQAAVPAGPEHRQGAHPQLHSQQDLEQRPALRHPLPAGVYGHAAQEDRPIPATPVHQTPIGVGYR